MTKASNNARSRHAAHHAAASRVIAGGVNSNVRLENEGIPLCFSRAQGAYLVDLNGKKYVDYALGMGPAILGHAPRELTDAVIKSLSRGQLYAGQSRMEYELGRRVQKYVPLAELVRIGMTGSEMVQLAVRIARAATGRARLVKFAGHYHGWFDSVLSNEVNAFPGPPLYLTAARPQTAGQAPGALCDTVVLPWNDAAILASYLERFGAETAAVIMEPVMCNTGVIPPGTGYLSEVRRLCDRHGVVLVFDEVITGFRLGLSGAQGLFGVAGDLCVLAKALGGGVPVAALGGRRSLMSLVASGSVNHSGTYNSNTLSVCAAIATVDALAAGDGAVYTKIDTIGRALMEGMRSAASEANQDLVIQGYPSVFNTTFGATHLPIRSADEYQQCDLGKQRRFLSALLCRGIRPTARGTWFVSGAHTRSDVKRTLTAVRGALQEVDNSV